MSDKPPPSVAQNFSTPRAVDLRHVSPGDRRRAEWLRQVIAPGGVGVECGVFKGEFSAALLDELAPRTLYLMDPWYLMTREWHWGEGDRSTISALCGILRAFEEELVAGRVVLRIADDLVSLAELPDGHLDWAYVDSTHLYAPTVKELAVLRKKVKPGGIVSGHDWQSDPSHRHHGVCKAVQEAVERGDFSMVLIDEQTIQWAVRVPERVGESLIPNRCPLPRSHGEASDGLGDITTGVVDARLRSSRK